MDTKKYEDIFLFIAHYIEKQGYDPQDPGGVTIFGITKLYHPKMFNKMRDAVHAGDKTNLDNVIKDVYSEYYETVTRHANKLEFLFPLNIQYFDMAFNAGCDDAIFVLQRTIKEIFKLDDLVVDGAWGPQTEKTLSFVRNNITECLKARMYDRYVINRIDRYTEKNRRYVFGLIKHRVLQLSNYLENNGYVKFCTGTGE